MNPYLQFADSIRIKRKPIVPRVVVRESQAPKVPTPAEKEIRENNAQLRRYIKGKAIELKHLLDGEVGEELRKLRNLLRAMTPADGDRLLQFMADHGWFQHLDLPSRHVILDMIDAAIIRMRVRNGLSPIDDSLPGDEPTIFEICRAKLVEQPR